MPTTLCFPPEKDIFRYLTHHPFTKDPYFQDKGILQKISAAFANQEKYRIGVQLTVAQVINANKVLPQIGTEFLIKNFTQALVDCAQGQLLPIRKEQDEFPSYETLLDYFMTNSVTNNSFFIEHGILELLAWKFAHSSKSPESIKEILSSVFQLFEEDLGLNLPFVSMSFEKALRDYADQKGGSVSLTIAGAVAQRQGIRQEQGQINSLLPSYWILQAIFDDSIDAVGDQLAVICRTPLAERIGACFSNIGNPQLSLKTRAFNTILVPFRLSRVIDQQIAASSYPTSLAMAKGVISFLVVEWFKNDPAKRNKLKNEIIPLVAQKFLEQKIFNGFQMLFDYCDDHNYIEPFRDLYTRFYCAYPNLGDILNSELVSMGFNMGASELVSLPSAAIIKLFRK